MNRNERVMAWHASVLQFFDRLKEQTGLQFHQRDDDLLRVGLELMREGACVPDTLLRAADALLYEIIGSKSSVPPKPGVRTPYIATSKLEDLGMAIDEARSLGCVSLLDVITRQAKFSAKTFGPGKRTRGIIAHLQEECDEVVESGHDVTECVDVLILALDLCWRSGASPAQIAGALAAKMERNEQRKWPEVGSIGEDQKINHDRSAD